MDATSTITQKGQVTIPLFMRKSLGLDRGAKVVFIKQKNRIYIKSAHNFLDFAGSVKTDKPFNIKGQEKEAQSFVSKRHAQSR